MPATAKACACRSGSSSGLLSCDGFVANLRTSCRPGKRSQEGRPSLRLFRLDQDECDPAGLGSTVDPGMVGALLNQYVASLEMHLAVVEQHVDLALHDDGVMDGECAVHQRVPRRQSLFGRVVADLLVQVVLLELLDLGWGRRDIDDA